MPDCIGNMFKTLNNLAKLEERMRQADACRPQAVDEITRRRLEAERLVAEYEPFIPLDTEGRD